MSTVASDARAAGDPVPNAIGAWRDEAFLVRVFGPEGGLAEAYDLIETDKAGAEKGSGQKATPRAITADESAQLDVLQAALDEDTTAELAPWTTWRDFAFEAMPGRVYLGMSLSRADTGEAMIWAKGAWLDPLMPQTQQEFLDYFAIATRRNLDPETAFHISRQIYASWAETGEAPPKELAGYVINCFVVYLYKAIELGRRPGDAKFDKYKAYAFKAVEQLSEEDLGVRHDKIHVYASIHTVLWHWCIIDGDYQGAYDAALGVFDYYKQVVHERELAQPEGSPEVKFQTNRAFNYAISILVLGVLLAAQKKPKSTIRISRTNIDVFRRAVQTGTKNVTWYAELAVSHAAAAACLNLADRVEKGTVPISHGYLMDLIWNAPRIKTPEFEEATSQMIRTFAARSGAFTPDPMPTVVTAVRGVVMPVPDKYRHGIIEVDLAYTGPAPERIELRFRRAEGYERVEAPAHTFTVDEEAGLVRLRYPVGPDTEPFTSIRVFTAGPGQRLAKAIHDEEGWQIHSLFFFNRRAFERGYYVRRKRGKDNHTLLFAAEQLADRYDSSMAHRAVIAVVYAYRALEVWDVFRARTALENIDRLIGHKRLLALPATMHIRQDPRHLVQSMLMARWHLAVALLDEGELLKTVTQASVYGEGHIHPGILHSYNSVRMSMIGAFLLRKYGRTEDAIASTQAARRLFDRAFANEQTHPNKEWGMLDFEVEHTREVVERQERWVAGWAEGREADEEQDDVVLKATRLLGEEGRENLRHNFSRLVGRIAKARESQAFDVPDLPALIEAERGPREAAEAAAPLGKPTR